MSSILDPLLPGESCMLSPDRLAPEYKVQNPATIMLWYGACFQSIGQATNPL